MAYRHGMISLHELSCGCVEPTYVSSETGEELTSSDASMMRVCTPPRPVIDIRFWMESEHFHIRAHELDGRGRLCWNVFDPGELGKARAFYRETIKKAKAKNL